MYRTFFFSGREYNTNITRIRHACTQYTLTQYVLYSTTTIPTFDRD